MANGGIRVFESNTGCTCIENGWRIAIMFIAAFSDVPMSVQRTIADLFVRTTATGNLPSILFRTTRHHPYGKPGSFRPLTESKDERHGFVTPPRLRSTHHRF